MLRIVISSAGLGLVNEIVVVDFDKRIISEGMSYFGLQNLQHHYRFSGFEKIFINTTAKQKLLNTRVAANMMHTTLYKAFVKTLEGDKICIGVDMRKERLIKKISNVRAIFYVPVFDNTEGVPVEI